MATIKHLVEMLQRVKDGPPCTEQEWDQKIIPEVNRKYLKKYDLQGTYNPETPVNQDLELADRYFEAGLDMAAEIGLFCPDTETIIHLSKDEILQALEDIPDHLILGEGRERITLKARRPEDATPPIFAGPLCIVVSEELYIPLAEGVLRSKKVRMHEGPLISTVFGKSGYAGTPFETATGIRNVQLMKEAQWRAGRSGIANMGLCSSPTEYGNMGGFALLNNEKNPAIAIVLNPPELKTTYSAFHKAIHAVGCGGYISCGGGYAMIGGSSGSPEGCALTNIATDILFFAVMRPDLAPTGVHDMRLDSSVGRHALWANTVANQACARNTDMMTYRLINQLAGPCTEGILQMSTAGSIAFAVSGVAFQIGVRSAGGRFQDHVSPLEHWFMADVFESTAGMSLGKANEIVLHLLSKYEATMKEPMKGKSFVECFDIETMTPSKEWIQIAEKEAADLRAHGLPMGDPILVRG